MSALLKAAGMAMIFCCCAGAGFGMAKALTDRVGALETALAIIGAFASELSYRLAPPDEALASLLERPSFAQVGYLQSCAKACARQTPFPAAWRETLVEQPGALSNEDAALLVSLADTLGQSDLDGQLASIAHLRELLQTQLEQARRRVGSHAGLYRTLGVLAGVFWLIVSI